HIGAVADPRRVVADCRGWHAEFLQIVETGNPGPVTADSGIVEDRRRGAELRREVRGIDAAVRGIDDDRAPRLRLGNPGDAVGDDDRRGGGGHGWVHDRAAGSYHAGSRAGATSPAISALSLLPLRPWGAERV